MSNPFTRLRPLWAGLALLAVLAIALSFPSVQALASNFLSLFRVQQVTALPLDMAALKDSRYDPSLGETLAPLIAQQVTFTRKPAKAQDIADPAQASGLAGFNVRLSSDPNQALSRLMLQPGLAFEGSFDRALAEQALQALVKSGQVPALPGELDGAKVRVSVPDGVSAAYGKCRYNTDPAATTVTGSPTLGIGDKCLVLVQVPGPKVETPPDLPVARLAEIGLRALGTSPEQAARLAAQIDWTTTLVIPIPRGQVDSRQLAVDGVQGTLLTQAAGQGSLQPGYSLVWVKNGIVYAILGTGDPAAGLALASSLK